MQPTSATESGAWVTELKADNASSGPLHGLRFALKDMYAIKGHRNACGNPTWYDTHSEATSTAPCVQQLLDAGAELVGITHMDELAYSLNGENHHFGTPVNHAAPDRIPGGSSSGSAVRSSQNVLSLCMLALACLCAQASVRCGLCNWKPKRYGTCLQSAVAWGEVDFAIGSDTAGSIRVPASYQGLFGIRPTHGAVSLQDAVALAPGFDTCGWCGTVVRLAAWLVPRL